jgi:hypothetical protein
MQICRAAGPVAWQLVPLPFRLRDVGNDVTSRPWEAARGLVAPVLLGDVPAEFGELGSPRQRRSGCPSPESGHGSGWISQSCLDPGSLPGTMRTTVWGGAARWACWPCQGGESLESAQLSELFRLGSDGQTLLPAAEGSDRPVCRLLSLVFGTDGFSVILLCSASHANPLDYLMQRLTAADEAVAVGDWFQEHGEADEFLLGNSLNLRTAYRWSQCSLNLQPTLAVGAIRQTVALGSANPLAQEPTGADSVLGPDLSGVLGSGSSYDMRSQNRVVMPVPELQIEFAIHLSRSLRTFVGYDLLFWSDNSRSGDPLASRPVSTTAPNAPILPAPLFSDRGFWAQGLTFGLELRY